MYINKGEEVMDNYIYAMGEGFEKAVEVKELTPYTIETRDCFNCQIDSEDYVLDSLDWDHINPATGPFYLANAKVDDVLKVKIIAIELADEGTMCCLSDNGVLGKDISEASIKKIPVKDGYAKFNEFNIPIKPMIGVIGVAPGNGMVNCGTPGKHGGNMDNTKIGVGSTLYLPVFKDGAYFSLGDVHAVMGDGEIMVSGVEINARVTVEFEVIKGVTIKEPRLEDEKYIYTIASNENIEEAIYSATLEMNKLLQKHLGYSLNEAGMLMSAVGDLEFCQVVDPERTVRFKMPKYICDKVI